MKIDISDCKNLTAKKAKIRTQMTELLIEFLKEKFEDVEGDVLQVGTNEVAVAVAYPSNPKLNTPGNIVIQGHNYRNGKFFSNNKNLSVGDKIKITDTSNKTLTYTIYEIFQTTSEDAEYMTRDTGDNIEISLSTCTDDSKGRLVILARV